MYRRNRSRARSTGRGISTHASRFHGYRWRSISVAATAPTSVGTSERAGTFRARARATSRRGAWSDTPPRSSCSRALGWRDLCATRVATVAKYTLEGPGGRGGRRCRPAPRRSPAPSSRSRFSSGARARRPLRVRASPRVGLDVACCAMSIEDRVRTRPPHRGVPLLPSAPFRRRPREPPAARHDDPRGDALVPREHRAEGAARSPLPTPCSLRGEVRQEAGRPRDARRAGLRVPAHAPRRDLPAVLPLGNASNDHAMGDALPLVRSSPRRRRAQAHRPEARRADSR